MLIKDILPNKEISEYIQCFRIVHMVPANGISHFSKYYIPKPEMVLHAIIKGVQKIKLTTNPATEFIYKYFLSGQQTAPVIFNGTGEFINFQIVFKPTALYKITGIPSSEFADKFTDTSLIFGSSIFSYFEQLQNATSYSEMVIIAERFVLKLIENAKIDKTQIDNIFIQKNHFSNNNSINLLAKESYFCEKQFKRVFFDKVGVNPKTYFKLTRFFKAYNIKNAKPHWDWLKIAIESNYYDYQHLSKDYLHFTNHTPVQFHQQIEPNSPEVQLGIAQQIYKDRFLQLPQE
jgi:AraC-like DNA-binding protein